MELACSSDSCFLWMQYLHPDKHPDAQEWPLGLARSLGQPRYLVYKSLPKPS